MPQKSLFKGHTTMCIKWYEQCISKYLYATAPLSYNGWGPLKWKSCYGNLHTFNTYHAKCFQCFRYPFSIGELSGARLRQNLISSFHVSGTHPSFRGHFVIKFHSHSNFLEEISNHLRKSLCCFYFLVGK